MARYGLYAKSARRWRFGLFVAAAAALILTACSATIPDPPAMTPPEPAEKKVSRAAPDASTLAAAYNANPSDTKAALAYARVLRSSGAKTEALAVLDQTAAATKEPEPALTLERGLLALDVGHTGKAETLLKDAADAKVADWRVHSGLGTVFANRGRQQEAQAQFAKALALAPDHPSILTNLALSYALDGKMDEAEKLLRRAQRTNPRNPQVQQNLALVLGLRGKFDESRSLAEQGLPPAKAAENVAYLQKLTQGKQAQLEKKSAANTTPQDGAQASLPQPTYQLAGPRPAP
jgi:Flp pilus assembly protein TadD